MSEQIEGIHHVTAIAGDPQHNVDFYTGVLGLRLVKLTVNFDDPGTYHVYFGDEAGRPGTILTFFPWPGAPRGRRGVGQATSVAFSVPAGALGYWSERLDRHGVTRETPRARFDETVLPFLDPDGLSLELVAHEPAAARAPRNGGPVPPEVAIRGFFGVTLAEEGYERTAEMLTRTLGFRLVGEEGSRFRFATGAGACGGVVDLACLPDAVRGHTAVGSVHHVAWRTATPEAQAAWRGRLAGAGLDVTPVIDRKYFRSVYFREPGGVLFEIATDPPGFAVDEPADELGSHLMLPAWLEPARARVEHALPPLRLPQPLHAR
ncbi:MAG TPA: ring-cleaving dioxygenase [Thermoanaerobaculaceae bacterium]|nr:ring-cleaving dioxygenase [Thermoanaerobaculaceae bacterium]